MIEGQPKAALKRDEVISIGCAVADVTDEVVMNVNATR